MQIQTAMVPAGNEMKAMTNNCLPSPPQQQQKAQQKQQSTSQ